MDGYLPLKPGGATFSFAGAPTASSPALVFPGAGEATYVFDNTRNAQPAWIGYGMTSDAAKANAVIPGAGAVGANVLCVGKNVARAFTLNAGMFFSVIMEQGSGTVSAVGGYGTI